MILAEPYNALRPDVEMRVHPMMTAANGAGILVLATGKTLEPVEHLVEPVDMRKHRMLAVSPDILTVEFSVVVYLNGNHPRTVDDAFLFVHYDFHGFFPTTNDSLPVLIETHGHGVSP